ncbi:hypothetical protein, partial [Paenibacillus sp. LK1]|uniref:hypothetical protein n=1 Tax=Paenibacillus sp. LK1 TaxID=2053014 RepID=UPI001C5581C3
SGAVLKGEFHNEGTVPKHNFSLTQFDTGQPTWASFTPMSGGCTLLPTLNKGKRRLRWVNYREMAAIEVKKLHTHLGKSKISNLI